MPRKELSNLNPLVTSFVRSLLCACLLVPAVAQAGGVAWSNEAPAKVLAAAKTANKPILVDVFATWCGPCMAMDAKVFSREDVAKALSETFVLLRVNAEEGDGPAIVERYNVVGYPTYLVLSPDGAEIDRVFGDMPAEEFVSTTQNFARGIGTLSKVAEEWRAQPHNVARAGEVAFRAAVRGDETLAKAAYAHLFALARILSKEAAKPSSAEEKLLSGLGSPSPETKAELERFSQAGIKEMAKAATAELPKAYLTLAKYLYLRGKKQPAAAIAILEELRRLYPQSNEAKTALYELAVAHVKAGQIDRAKKPLDEYVQAMGEVDGANAYAWFCYKQNAFREDGIRVAEKALAKEPKQDGLWDTLAELYHAVGRSKDAVAAEEKAIAQNPDDPYYKRQKARFAAAMTAAK